MAKASKPNGHADKPGSNNPPTLTEDEFLALYQEREDAKSEHAAAVAACKEPKKALKDVEKRIEECMSLDAFMRTMEDILKPSYQREQEAAEYLRNMAWLGRPIGAQAAFSFETKEAGAVELHAIGEEGYAAGKAGHASDTNTFTPGTERYSVFETEWNRGNKVWIDEQTKIAESMGPASAGSGKPDGRKGRVISDAQKQAMKEGRERARAARA